MKSKRLKLDCPFCGSKVRLFDFHGLHYVKCVPCGFSTPQHKTKKSAIIVFKEVNEKLNQAGMGHSKT